MERYDVEFLIAPGAGDDVRATLYRGNRIILRKSISISKAHALMREVAKCVTPDDVVGVCSQAGLVGPMR